MNQEKLSKLKSGVQIGGKVRCLFRYIYTVKNPDITKMKNNLTVACVTFKLTFIGHTQKKKEDSSQNSWSR